MTRAITRAFDRRHAEPVVALPRAGIRSAFVPRPERRELSVQRALEWAFGTERVSIEFDEVNPDAGIVGCDPIYRMMRQAELGCRVDGGGQSAGHDDAEIIASIVARLPPGQGGKGMAVRIASLARAGGAPDWMPGATPRCVPRDGFRRTKHGDFARTEVIGQIETQYRGRKAQHDLVVCPVSYRPSADQISAARRAYLEWWGALLHLRHEIDSCGLTSLVLTGEMPILEPWRTKA